MKKKARHRTKAEETPEFVAFWEVWKPVMNRNDGRGDARDEFFRHVEEMGVDPQDIVDGARWFVRNGGNSTDWKLHAQTWLNKRAYEDGAESERAYQAKLAQRSTAPAIVPQKKPKFLEQWEPTHPQA